MGLEKTINGIKKAKGALKSLAYSAVMGASLLAGRTNAANSKYNIEKLTPNDPHANYSYALGINDNGAVLGNYGERYGSRPIVYVWQKYFVSDDGITRDIKLDPNSESCFFYCDDFDKMGSRINNLSDIAVSTSIIKSNNDDMILDSCDYCAAAINNKGDFIITSSNQSFLYSGGEITAVPPIPSGYSKRGYSINDNRQIIAYSGFFWEDGVTTTLKPGNYRVRAFDINNHGIIVGYWIDINTFACMWENKDSEPVLIGLRSSLANAINDSNQIVGYHWSSSEGQSREMKATLWEDGILIDLNKFLGEDSEWKRLYEARDINNTGQIIGWGYLKKGGDKQAFLMTPIPLEADLNDDDKVNGLDFAILANNWLEDQNYYPSESE
jgi:uncharacterized membrane protein